MRPWGANKFGPSGPFAKTLKDLGIRARFLDDHITGIDTSVLKAWGWSRGKINNWRGKEGEFFSANGEAQILGRPPITNEIFSTENGVQFRQIDFVALPSFLYRLFRENVIYNNEDKRVVRLGGAKATKQAVAYAETRAVPTPMAERFAIPGHVSDSGRTTLFDADGIAAFDRMRSIGGILKHLGMVGLALDAGLTAWRVHSLIAQGNTFSADSEWRHFLARTSLGTLGGMTAGALWGLRLGRLTGPVGTLLATGAGAVGGALFGDRVAKAYDQQIIDNGIGGNGNHYTYIEGANGVEGRWVSYELVPNLNIGSAAGSIWKRIEKPAPADQVPGLDFHRGEKIADLVLGSPEVLDTDHLMLDGKDWEKVRDGRSPISRWAHVVRAGRLSHRDEADSATSAKLDELARQRQTSNENGPTVDARSYLQTYYKNGWEKFGPLPEAVTSALNLRSERHIVDPATHITWNQGEDGEFTRTVMMPGVRGIKLPRKIPAKPIETERIKHLQHEVQVENAVDEGYGDIYKTSRRDSDPVVNEPYSRNSVDNWGGMGMAPAMPLKLGDLFARSVVTDPALMAPSPAASANATSRPTGKITTTVHIHLDGQKIDTQFFEHD
ncbi:hypothetical protein DYH55_00395 [Methylovirgula sp. 4M-Z18]|nr:hypothetical protein DYH55_00395 [Methylovirgula sp. 4M-Z18]